MPRITCGGGGFLVNLLKEGGVFRGLGEAVFFDGAIAFIPCFLKFGSQGEDDFRRSARDFGHFAGGRGRRQRFVK
jgi:hypothetical protein